MKYKVGQRFKQQSENIQRDDCIKGDIYRLDKFFGKVNGDDSDLLEFTNLRTGKSGICLWPYDIRNKLALITDDKPVYKLPEHKSLLDWITARPQGARLKKLKAIDSGATVELLFCEKTGESLVYKTSNQ